MGIIKAAVDAVSGGFADQWLEVIEADDMGQRTVFTKGIKIRNGQNTKGTDDTVSNGSIVHVYDNQFMMLVDGGKIVDYTAEPGYYKVDNASMPSLFNGNLKETVKESFSRIKFGGQTPGKQQVFFLNLQEIKGIKFGTRNPISYFDNFYNAELSLRAHGSYSIRITDPIKFYQEVIPRNVSHVDIETVNEQYISEFLEGFQVAITEMSVKGEKIFHLKSKLTELSKHMAEALDADWNEMRGMEVQSVGIADMSYDPESQKLINMRNAGAMLSDPTIREGYIQKNISEGLKAAGSNANGAMAGFMGMGMGMQAGGGMMGAASATNMQQMQMQHEAKMQQQAAQQQAAAAQQQAAQQTVQQTAGAAVQNTDGWTCECGALNTGKFCSECGKAKPVVSNEWTCECGAVNTGKFCSECGKAKPVVSNEWTCECGAVNTGKFCSECGKPRA